MALAARSTVTSTRAATRMAAAACNWPSAISPPNAWASGCSTTSARSTSATTWAIRPIARPILGAATWRGTAMWTTSCLSAAADSPTTTSPATSISATRTTSSPGGQGQSAGRAGGLLRRVRRQLPGREHPPAAVPGTALHDRRPECLPGVGGRALNLSFEDSAINSFRSLFGSQLDFRASSTANLLWTLYGAWMHEYDSEATAGVLTGSLAALPGTMFQVRGPSTGSDWLLAGCGVRAPSAANVCDRSPATT